MRVELSKSCSDSFSIFSFPTFCLFYSYYTSLLRSLPFFVVFPSFNKHAPCPCAVTPHTSLSSYERKREWESAGLECDSRVQSVLIATLANHHDILEKTGVSLGRWGPPPSFSLVRFQCCTQCLVATGAIPRSRATRVWLYTGKGEGVPPRENRWGFVFSFVCPYGAWVDGLWQDARKYGSIYYFLEGMMI